MSVGTKNKSGTHMRSFSALELSWREIRSELLDAEGKEEGEEREEREEGDVKEEREESEEGDEDDEGDEAGDGRK